MSMHSVENMIHIRSKDRHAHEGMCCFNVHMKEPIQVLEGWSATCQLSNAQIPFSHRPVNTYNNTLAGGDDHAESNRHGESTGSTDAGTGVLRHIQHGS